MDDTQKDKHDHPLVSEENWLYYYHSLHSNKPLNPAQQAIINQQTIINHHLRTAKSSYALWIT